MSHSHHPEALDSVEEVRRAVAAQLGTIRRDAGLTGLELAKRCGWHASKRSRIENARTRPSDKDIRAWCRACGAEEQIPNLIASSRDADSMYREWKRVHSRGLKRAQDSVVPLYLRTEHMRVYCSNVIPGLVQTAGYATALLSSIAAFESVANDAEEAAIARVARSEIIYDTRRRFALLIEEDVLYFRFGDADVMSRQLGYLLSVMTLPNVSLGIIPRSAVREMWTLEGFVIYDDVQVQVETLSADMNIKRPGEVILYQRAFRKLSEMAVHGSAARALIREALGTLD
ncbi:helix-turn-helix transcriptional regulator [Streptomyces sp. NPDC093109]|uniref:helix-turn-helix domain-containing protein n=1 Tax=Streptomyces sp. NPDC093109 TaxID=3154977 RepID=UPI00344BA2EB